MTPKAIILLLGLCAGVSVSVAVSGQSQEAINAISAARLDMLAGRVSVLESTHSDGRLRVLESDMVEVKWISRSVILLVAGQLVTMLLGLRNGRRP